MCLFCRRFDGNKPSDEIRICLSLFPLFRLYVVDPAFDIAQFRKDCCVAFRFLRFIVIPIADECDIAEHNSANRADNGKGGQNPFFHRLYLPSCYFFPLPHRRRIGRIYAIRHIRFCKVCFALVAVIFPVLDVYDNSRRFRIRDRIVNRSRVFKLHKAVICESCFDWIGNSVRRMRRDNFVIAPVVLDDFAHGVICVRVLVFRIVDNLRRLQDHFICNDVRSRRAILYDLRLEGKGKQSGGIFARRLYFLYFLLHFGVSASSFVMFYAHSKLPPIPDTQHAVSASPRSTVTRIFKPN
nr:MAG TPA: hypothetical protein [Caudoviricetes sp.]